MRENCRAVAERVAAELVVFEDEELEFANVFLDVVDEEEEYFDLVDGGLLQFEDLADPLEGDPVDQGDEAAHPHQLQRQTHWLFLHELQQPAETEVGD